MYKALGMVFTRKTNPFLMQLNFNTLKFHLFFLARNILHTLKTRVLLWLSKIEWINSMQNVQPSSSVFMIFLIREGRAGSWPATWPKASPLSVQHPLCPFLGKLHVGLFPSHLWKEGCSCDDTCPPPWAVPQLTEADSETHTLLLLLEKLLMRSAKLK